MTLDYHGYKKCCGDYGFEFHGFFLPSGIELVMANRIVAMDCMVVFATPSADLLIAFWRLLVLGYTILIFSSRGGGLKSKAWIPRQASE